LLQVNHVLLAAKDRLATIRTDALLMDAARLLSESRINLVVVCGTDDKLAGVITKTDVIGRMSICAGHSCRMAAADVMTRDVTYCSPDEWLQDVWTTIKRCGLKNLPVVDEASVPLGVLNARDALQALLQDVQNEEELLRDYVMGMGYR